MVVIRRRGLRLSGPECRAHVVALCACQVWRGEPVGRGTLGVLLVHAGVPVLSSLVLRRFRC
jgi:hypothetical protein